MPIDYQGSGGGVPRKTAHIFAKDAAANDVTIFGSTLASDTQYTTDIEDIQTYIPDGDEVSTFETGWRKAVISNKNYPLMGDMNGIQKTFSQQIAYLLQHGVSEWDKDTTYYTYDIVNVNGILYISTIDENTNNNPTTLTGWAVYYDPENIGVYANIDLSNLSVYGEAKISNYMRYVVNDGNIDANGKLDLIDAEESTDTTYSYAQPGTYTFTVPTTATYPIALIAPGGKGSQSFNQQLAAWYVAGGGSGGGFVGTINLTAGTYTIEVGSGQSRNSTVLKDSNDNVLLTATAGNNGTSSATGSAGGNGGSLTVASGVTVSANTVGSNNDHDDGNGYKGQQGLIYGYMGQALGGASIYNGYGKGGNNVQKGWDGYFEIVIQNQGSSEVNYKVSSSSPLTIVDAQGVKSVLYGVNNDQIGSLANGTYHKFVDTTGTDFLANNIYYQLKVPTSPSTNDVWVKTAEKIEVFKYDGADWQPYNRVLIGTVKVSSGAVAAGGIKNVQLYDNGFNVTTYQRTHYIVQVKTGSQGMWSRLYSDGWLEQGGTKINPLSSTGELPIDFLDSFGNTDYKFFRSPVWASLDVQATSDVYSVGCLSKSHNKVTVASQPVGRIAYIDWYACGYKS